MNDDELRARLQAVDPARALTDDWRFEVPEADMSTPTPTPARGRWALAAAAAVVVLVTGIGLVTLWAGGGDDVTPRATGPQHGNASTVTYRFDDAGQAARCIPPHAEGIRALDTAFKGTVLSVSGGKVVLRPTATWRGPRHDRVVLATSSTQGNYEALPVQMRKGASYIVAVKDGIVQLCGYTWAAHPDLEQMYRDALGLRK